MEKSQTLFRRADEIKDIEHVITVRASIVDAFEALTVPAIMDEWGGGPARVQARPNGRYSLWDGDVVGTVKEVEYPRLIVHSFREISWDDAYLDSIVTWSLEETERGTRITLQHTGLPTRRLREIHDEMWAESFLGPLKVHLEGS